MEARHEARKDQLFRDKLLAWQIGNFTGAAFGGKLKDFKHYSREETEDNSRGGFALLGRLLAMKSRGVGMTVERLTRAA